MGVFLWARYPCMHARGMQVRVKTVNMCVGVYSLQGLLEHAVGAYSRPLPVSLGPSCERCGALCSGKTCIHHVASSLLSSFLGL